ncbi:MAG: hypothetical protein JWQ76_4846 [Ramlibacter sp.]|nr:hypothetical protein [Ramlibacter sp.]
MATRLVIGASSYGLAQARGGAWVELAVLPGGAEALLPAPRRANEAGLEAAIELAEDWLMPHARAIQGEELELVDDTGRLVSGLVAVLSVGQREWSTEGIETMFLRLVDMATGRGPAIPADQTSFVVDLLLVRELAHHGRLRRVRIVDGPE